MARFDDIPLDPWGSLAGRAALERRCTHRAGRIDLVLFLVNRGGIPARVAAEMSCPDVHLLATTLMRARFVALADTRLIAELPDRRPAERFTVRSLVFAWSLLAAIVLVVVGLYGSLTFGGPG